MKKLFFILLFICNLFANEFKVASYNVENLFDLNYDGSEYHEFIPYKKYWDKQSFQTKVKNLIKVANDLNADILVLQEVENKKLFMQIAKKLNYKYTFFSKKPKSAIGIGILSKFPISNKKLIDIEKYNNYSRYILKTTHKIDNKLFHIYSNHWPSKRGPESLRIKYALKLKQNIDKHNPLDDYIIVGDLNSNYNEFITFKYEKKLNDTYNITGINQVLNTTIDGNFVQKDKVLSFNKKVHFNPWLELKHKDRFSAKYRRKNNTPDHILLSASLFDNKHISYVENSFGVFKPSYLYKNNKIKRWHHKKAKGFSDHLPIYATFTTKKINHFNKINHEKKTISKISHLYTIDRLNENIILKDITLLYKYKKHAILKQINDRAILFYGDTTQLQYGKNYTISTDKIDNYFGAKEIKNITIISQKKSNTKPHEYFKEATNTELFDEINQNEIITNLAGIYKKNYLYYDKSDKNKRIRVYFKKNVVKPKSNTFITINRGHLSQYKSKIQIVIYSNENFKSN